MIITSHTPKYNEPTKTTGKFINCGLTMLIISHQLRHSSDLALLTRSGYREGHCFPWNLKKSLFLRWFFTIRKTAFAISGHFAVHFFVTAVLWSILPLSYSSEPSVARCAIFPQNLVIFWFGWRVKFAFGGWRIFWLFLKLFGWKFGGFLCKISTSVWFIKNFKNPLNIVYCRRIHCFVTVPAASVHRKPCFWLGFSDQIVPRQVDVVDVCWTA